MNCKSDTLPTNLHHTTDQAAILIPAKQWKDLANYWPSGHVSQTQWNTQVYELKNTICTPCTSTVFFPILFPGYYKSLKFSNQDLYKLKALPLVKQIQ